MAWRFATFASWQLAMAALCGWQWGEEGALAGAVAGAALWFLFDLAQGARVLRWLRNGLPPASVPTGGIWGEAAERMRRVLRARDQQAEASDQRLQDFLSAIQASPNGVVLLDAEGRIEWFNLTAAGHLGIDPERDLQQLIGNLLREPAFAAYYAGGNYAQEITIPGRGGTATRPVRLSVHLHPYDQGRKLLLSRDVTAIEQAEVMRRDFVANVSHEIRTPLTVLMGFVETLQHLPLEAAERARYLAMMAQQGHRMQSLVNDLLTLSRLEGSPFPGPGEWTPASLLLAQAEEEARGLVQAFGKPQVLRFGPAAAVEVAGASSELESAFANLVTNAIRYTPAGGTVDVQWRAIDGGRAEFSVTDTGPGIAPEHIPRLTERFYRVDRSRSRDTGGTGLGLAIVKHVAQRHGAELRIESTVGVGSRFSIVLPASRVRPSAGSPAARPATESAAG